MKIETIAQLLTGALIICAVCCKKDNPTRIPTEKRDSTARLFYACNEQYLKKLWLHRNDSIALPFCPGHAGTAGKLDSVVLTYKSPTSDSYCQACFSFTHQKRSELYVWNLRAPMANNVLLDFTGGIGLRVMDWKGDSVLVAIWYNYDKDPV